MDRFAVQITTQFCHQFTRRRVTSTRILLQTFQADGFQVLIQSRVQLTRCHRFLFQNRHQRVHHVRRLKRRTTRQQRVQDRAQRIDVRCRADCVCLTGRLFRRHVAGCAQDLTGSRQATVRVRLLRQSEIRHFRLTGPVDQHIRRLQVPVDHIL